MIRLMSPIVSAVMLPFAKIDRGAGAAVNFRVPTSVRSRLCQTLRKTLLLESYLLDQNTMVKLGVPMKHGC